MTTSALETMNDSSVSYSLTSTTAPGKLFASRNELAEHYKSDWHKYNLKRREAGLPVLLQADFEARLQAAQALRSEQKQAGKDHLKKKTDKKETIKIETTVPTESEQETSTDGENGIKKKEESTTENGQKRDNADNGYNADQSSESNGVVTNNEATNDDDMKLEIDPRQCLFDNHLSSSVVANSEYMLRQYGFFIPDREYLIDMEGLFGYCHEQIRLGHMCLFCQRVFTTYQGCQKHMIDKVHTKLRYSNEDMEDLAVFYDFSAADAEFLGSVLNTKGGNKDKSIDKGEDNDDGWEDMSEDGNEEDDVVDDDDDDDMFNGYEEAMNRMGFEVTPLGELVFPDGRIVGHRSLRRYYKQRLPVRQQQSSTAVLAARAATGERLIRGRVFNVQDSLASTTSKFFALNVSEINAAKGLLVPAANGTISQVSLYRYRAALRKQRVGEEQARRLHHKTILNVNRMDKKANRLMNNVSVAHAAR